MTSDSSNELRRLRDAVATHVEPVVAPSGQMETHDHAPHQTPIRVCELRIEGIGGDSMLATVRWDLFACPEIRHVFRIGTTDRALIVYNGSEPAPDRWAAAAHAAQLPSRPRPPAAS